MRKPSTHTPHYDRLKARLVALREGAGLTQRQLAARVGRDQSVIARIETGERRLDVVELFTLCVAMGLDPLVAFETLASDLIEVNAARARAARRKKQAKPRTEVLGGFGGNDRKGPRRRR